MESQPMSNSDKQLMLSSPNMIPTRVEPCKAMKSSTWLVMLSRVLVEIDKLPKNKLINSSTRSIRTEMEKLLSQNFSKFWSSWSIAPTDYDYPVNPSYQFLTYRNLSTSTLQFLSSPDIPTPKERQNGWGWRKKSTKTLEKKNRK